MKRKLKTLVEEETMLALENLDLDRIGEEAAKEAVRSIVNDMALEDQLYEAVRDAILATLHCSDLAEDAAEEAIAAYAEDLAGGWMV